MNCLVVEDSRLAREELVRQLKRQALFATIHEAADAESARNLLHKYQIDLLLLDIHLPGETGFELLESLLQVPPVIFTTAYDKYALRSFDFSTIDYLVKPIRTERLTQALAKWQQFSPAANATTDASAAERLFIRDGDQTYLAPLADIRYLESVGNYTRVYYGKQRPLLNKSLRQLTIHLAQAGFFRISRQHVVNVRAIVRLDERLGKTYAVTTTNESLPIARRRTKQLRAALAAL